MKKLFITYLLLLVTEFAFCQTPHITEQLTYNTIRIETDKPVGAGLHLGGTIANIFTWTESINF